MYLLDTDTLIYSFKGNEKVIENIKNHADAPKALSVISYGELIYGAHKSAQVSSNLAKVHRLREILPIIDTTSSIMECYGSIKAELSKKGITVDDFDLLIGSTAITLGYTVVTNNEKHFKKIPDLKIVNWYKK
jgi:tRNA(fMet)-specific endonuclease VapC